MPGVKIGDLVELLDRSCSSDRKGNFLYWPTGFIGIVVAKDISNMPIVHWLNLEDIRDSWPEQHLKLLSRAL